MALSALRSSIVAARSRICPFVRRTPLEVSGGLSAETGAQVFLKLENEQQTGSFKVRGAVNKLRILQDTGKYCAHNPPVTASTGNHALACVYATRALGMQCSIVLPETVSPAKRQNLELAGASLTFHGTDGIESEIRAEELATETGKVYISPYNDYDIVAGQGTIGAEILDDLPDVDAVFVSVGGGGLIGGIAAYLKATRPKVKVIGCQPIRSKVMYESVQAGEIVEDETLETLSDGTAGGMKEAEVTFPLCRDYVDDWVLVEEEAIGRGIYSVLDLHHKVVEGAAGVVVGAFHQVASQYQGQKVVLIMCGANIATDKLQSIVNEHHTDNKQVTARNPKVPGAILGPVSNRGQ